ncbi:MAG: TorF family putative porin [Halioglobus sp.]
MLNKKLLPAALATSLLAGATAAQAEMEISANVALTTDYKFRGISQSDESPALQGGFDLAFDNGMYVGTWASSVDFDTNGDGFDGSLELDYYVGWGGEISDSVGVDVGILYYSYPGDDGADGDYLEFYGSVSIADGTLGFAYSDDYYGETDTFYYLYGDYSFSLGENLSLDLHVGYNDLDEDGGFLSDGQDSYVDYSVGLSTSFASVDLSLAVVGTDLDEEEVFGTDWGEDSVIFTISKSM